LYKTFQEIRMPKHNFILPEDSDRNSTLESIGFPNDDALKVAVSAMVTQASKENPLYPNWFPLGARVAEGIFTLRSFMQMHGWVGTKSDGGLDGLIHIESGRFLAIHNTCERTGLAGALPRFIAARKRAATKSLRDDLQDDLFETLDDQPSPKIQKLKRDELATHLCVFIASNKTETGGQTLTVRAELVVGAACSNLGIVACQHRIVIETTDLDGSGAYGDQTPDTGPEDAFETHFAISRRT
jgi:hypothetical protein